MPSRHWARASRAIARSFSQTAADATDVSPEETEAVLDMAVAERRLVEAPLGPYPSPFLIDEIASGLLGPVDQTDGAGLYLAYVRHAPSMECSGFRLVLAPGPESAYKHLGSPPGGDSFAIRPLRIRYPGQLVAAGLFFGVRIERATRYSSGVREQG